jgi:hypothetical protein
VPTTAFIETITYVHDENKYILKKTTGIVAPPWHRPIGGERAVKNTHRVDRRGRGWTLRIRFESLEGERP